MHTLLFLNATLALLICVHLLDVEGCSSRTWSKPRPTTSSSILMKSTTSSTTLSISTTAATTTTSTTTTTQRPNVTFPTYKCPATYDAWYCLNEATCFSVKIGESLMFNCECANGFMGPRCEYKELDGSLLPKRSRPVLEVAGMANGATCGILFVFFVALTIYLRVDQAGGLQNKKLNNDNLQQQLCNCEADNNDYIPLSMEQNSAKYRGVAHNHVLCQQAQH